MGSVDKEQHDVQGRRTQTPVAVVGMACRLPGHSNSPTALWDFLLRHGVADNEPPPSRFRLAGHYDGRGRLRTMKSPGGMFIEDVDPALFDGHFFRLKQADCVGMDPQQRQLLEVAYECLENAGTTLESLRKTSTGCIVGSSSSDYHDMQTHDPEDRPDSATIGTASAIHSNRISHFLDIHGPSFTVDTACSSSLVGVDVACRYLDSLQADGMLVGGVNLWLSPEHNQETGMLRAAQSGSGRCHSFDAKADGYVKAEGVSVVYLKRLDDALRDGDPVRAVIRGTAANSDGHTASGIASPSAEAQAACIRRAYANAGIVDLNQTGFLECHGTGTPTGDPIEVRAAASVFAPTREQGRELVIGSIKSNIGHSEAAAGLSGLIKAVLAVESGLIPGNPTFLEPNPDIDFHGSRVRATRTTIKWPKNGTDRSGDTSLVRRASVSSYGFGGANAHAVVESLSPEMLGCSRGVSSHNNTSFLRQLFLEDDEEDEGGDDSATKPPTVLFFSANDGESLRNYVALLSAHFIRPGVSVDLPDLAYTLSERRSRHYVGAFTLCRDIKSISEDSLVIGRKGLPSSSSPSRVCFVFTGQGAQWSQMGLYLVKNFPTARNVLTNLDSVLASLTDPPEWSLLRELTEKREGHVLRQPEFSQPLVTALQLALLAVTEDWGIHPVAVVGHSSGEIAAAACAGLISFEEAIKVAYYRGLAAKMAQQEEREPLGMLAAGVSAEKIEKYINTVASSTTTDSVQVACFNGPDSLTLSGPVRELERVRDQLQQDGHFARMLLVDLAYHSTYMREIAKTYERLLNQHCELQSTTPRVPPRGVDMFSSVTGDKVSSQPTNTLDAAYWKANMVSPVLFAQAASNMLSQQDLHGGSDNDSSATNIFLVEIGPSDTLSGPVSQIAKFLQASAITIYTSAWKRGADPMSSLYDTAGRLFLAAGNRAVDLTRVNRLSPSPRIITDLPNYAWNHTTRHWHETQASRDWRLKSFPRHDLIGSKITGTPWTQPTFHHTLRLSEQGWLRDHKLFRQMVFPGAAFVAMVVEAVWQAAMATAWNYAAPERYQVRLRDVHFTRALVLEEGEEMRYTISLAPARNVLGSSSSSSVSSSSSSSSSRRGVWYEFHVRSVDIEIETMMTAGGGPGAPPYCSGLACVEEVSNNNIVRGSLEETAPLHLPTPSAVWFRAMAAAGYNFGPNFRKKLQVESTMGSRTARTTISLVPPPSEYQQSDYALHPAVIDAALQTCIPPLWEGDVAAAGASRVVLIPQVIRSLVIPVRRGGGLQQQQAIGLAPSIKNRLPDEGICVSSAKWIGVGDASNPRNYRVSCSVYDPHDGEILFEMQTMTLGAIEASEERRVPHTVMREVWDADVGLLLKDKMLRDYLDNGTKDQAKDCVETRQKAKEQRLLDLVAHRNPRLRVLECNLCPGSDDTTSLPSSVWIHREKNGNGNEVSPIRRACRRYQFALPGDPSMLVHVQNELAPYAASLGNMQVSLLDDAVFSSQEEADGEGGFDLVIINDRGTPGETTTQQHVMVADGIHRCLHQGGFIMRLGSPKRPPTNLGDLEMADLGDGISIAQLNDEVVTASGTKNRPAISLVSFLPSPSETSLKIAAQLTSKHGWEINTCSEDEVVLPAGTPVLVLDEISQSIMDTLDEKKWLRLQKLIAQEPRILWVTSGAHLDVSQPTRAAIAGLFRTVRAEEGLRLMTLDAEEEPFSSSSHHGGTSILSAISTCLDLLCREQAHPGEEEYCEFVLRSSHFSDDAVLHISHVAPDEAATALQQREKEDDNENGKDIIMENTGLHSHPTTVQLGARHLGNIDSLRWSEVMPDEEKAPLPEGWLEIEVVAAGLNYKDIVVTMGIVPGNDHAMGGEAAGIVTRVGGGGVRKDDEVYSVGDRVVALCDKCFANRVRVAAARAHRIPDDMSFEEAATLLSVYLTAIHALLHLAGLKRGMSVLIHSAAGGLGIASIQLARYVGAEIYVTAGTPEKKEFLKSAFGLSQDRVFHSRDPSFADDILRVTNKRGVDVVLNSLAGDMLDASLGIVADGGVMVEVGKKDISDQKQLPMEPFDRNVSFHAVDMAPQRTSEELVARCMRELFELIGAGHVGPIKPLHVFPWTDAISALRILGSGKHIGKMVLSSGDANAEVEVPIRMAPRPLRFRPDSCYLLIGGLRGVCGALAVYMAKSGAKHLAVISRSGHDDEKSAQVVKQVRALGAHINLLIADVTIADEVERAFQQTTKPVAGIIQGAMVLRDRPFSSMTIDEYHQALDPKIKGTWNLHSAAEKLGLDLDFFTLLSSSSGVSGTRGQANYAAGNAFQDAFAAYRVQCGKPACAVDLGIVEGVGVIAEREDFYEKHLDARILRGIDPDLLQRILRVSILQQQQQQQQQQKELKQQCQHQGRHQDTPPHHCIRTTTTTAQMITGFVFPQPQESTLSRDPRFAPLFRPEGTTTDHDKAAGGGDGADLLQGLRALLRPRNTTATEQAKLAAVTEVLDRQLGRMLGLSSAMDPDRPLGSYGVDSLAAMEVRNWVRRGLGELLGAASITTLDIMGAGTLRAFAIKILDKIKKGKEATV